MLPGAQIMHTIYHFESWEVRNPVLQTVHDLDLKRRSYGRFKTDGAGCEIFFFLSAKMLQASRMACEIPILIAK